MSQYRSLQGNPPPIPVQMDKDRLMGQALGETVQPVQTNRQAGFDEVGRPMNVFRRFLRWLRKVFKGY